MTLVEAHTVIEQNELGITKQRVIESSLQDFSEKTLYLESNGACFCKLRMHSPSSPFPFSPPLQQWRTWNWALEPEKKIANMLTVIRQIRGTEAFGAINLEQSTQDLLRQFAFESLWGISQCS